MTLFSKTIALLSVFGFIAGASATDAGTDATSPLGYWQTERSEGKHASKINVYECGQNAVCGKIVALEEPDDPATGKPKVDPKGLPLMDLEIMKDFKKVGETKWENGEIYDPKEGKIYSAEFEMQDAGKIMKLRGYVKIPLFGKTQTWQRIGKDEAFK